MTASGGAGGFQMPMMTQKKVKEALKGRLSEAEIGIFVSSVTVESMRLVEAASADPVMLMSIAEEILGERLLRSIVERRLKEVVRKKKGGGGYTLYAPNKKKKGAAKSVGEFPTKLVAKKAELARFPPKELHKLQRLRKEVDRLTKDPKAAAEKEKTWAKDAKKEGFGAIRSMVGQIMTEALFKEDDKTSQWDERVAKLSKAAVEADSRLQSLEKTIVKKSESALTSSLQVLAKALKPLNAKVTSKGIKRDPARKATYLEVSIETAGSSVGPIYVYIEAGAPRIELSDEAKQSLSRVDAELAKRIRGELIAVHEDGLSGIDDVKRAIIARDRYLDKLEVHVDGFVSGLSALEVSLLKNLLVKKYRGGR